MTTASRAHARLQAVATATSRSTEKFRDPEAAKRVSEVFASNVFSYEQMKKSLGDEDLTILQEYAVSGTTLTSELADKVAQAAKEWARQRRNPLHTLVSTTNRFHEKNMMPFLTSTKMALQ